MLNQCILIPQNYSCVEEMNDPVMLLYTLQQGTWKKNIYIYTHDNVRIVIDNVRDWWLLQVGFHYYFV